MPVRTTEVRAKAAAAQRRYKERHPDRVAASSRKFSEAHPDYSRTRKQNRESNNRSHKKWRQANRDLHAQINLQAERYRARKANAQIGTVTNDLLSSKWEYWGGRCWMCGAEATSWDHVKPLSKGGAHCLANLRPACQPCNSRKGARWPDKEVSTMMGGDGDGDDAEGMSLWDEANASAWSLPAWHTSPRGLCDEAAAMNHAAHASAAVAAGKHSQPPVARHMRHL